MPRVDSMDHVKQNPDSIKKKCREQSKTRAAKPIKSTFIRMLKRKCHIYINYTLNEKWDSIFLKHFLTVKKVFNIVVFYQVHRSEARWKWHVLNLSNGKPFFSFLNIHYDVTRSSILLLQHDSHTSLSLLRTDMYTVTSGDFKTKRCQL